MILIFVHRYDSDFCQGSLEQKFYAEAFTKIFKLIFNKNHLIRYYNILNKKRRKTKYDIKSQNLFSYQI